MRNLFLVPPFQAVNATLCTKALLKGPAYGDHPSTPQHLSAINFGKFKASKYLGYDVHLGAHHKGKKNLSFIGISTYFAIKNKKIFLRWSGVPKQILSNGLGLCQSAMQLGIFRTMTRPEVSGLCFDLRCSLDILKITSKKGWSSRYLGRACFANLPPQVEVFSMEKRKEPSLKHAWIYIKSS